MHGNSIAGALLGKLRQMGWGLTLLIVTSLAVGTARADVTYDYTGNAFTNVVPLLCPDGGTGCPQLIDTNTSITGNIVLDNALPAAPTVLPVTTDNPAYQSFSFSDGANTITNTTSGVHINTSFTTNSLGRITSGTAMLTVTNPAGGLFLEMDITPFNDFDRYLESTGGGFLSAEGGSSTPGMWTSTPPSLYLTVNTDSNPATESLSGDPTGITATLSLATTQPAGSVQVPLTKVLSSNDTSLQQAATDLGYLGFDWVQRFIGPSPLPYYSCPSSSCPAGDSPLSDEVMGSSLDPAQPYGFDYCNPSSPNFLGGESCVHSDYYDPMIARDPIVSDTVVAGCIRYSLGVCVTTMTDTNDTELNFFDAPSDPCLVNQFPSLSPTMPAAVGQPSPAYLSNPPIKSGGPMIKDRCQGQTASGSLEFITQLVGLTNSGFVPLDTFLWTDTFNGFATVTSGTGGIIISPETQLEVDATSGTGGIEILQVGGKPVSPVSEPTTLSLLALGCTLLSFLARRRQPLVNHCEWH